MTPMTFIREFLLVTTKETLHNTKQHWLLLRYRELVDSLTYWRCFARLIVLLLPTFIFVMFSSSFFALSKCFSLITKMPIHIDLCSGNAIHCC